ncbi:MAG: helix-turn-helix domain-containing protein [Clostridia bacterium]|nr:helix-turn-helix domain-containing protein [Clostridia bacterium]
MLSNFVKTQLDSLAGLVGGLFGMVNESGQILYCAGGDVPETDSLFKGYLGNPGDLFAGPYFCLNDYIFCPVEIQGEDSVFLFTYLSEAARSESDKIAASKLLSVAAYAIADQEIRHERKLSDLFRRLIADNRKGIARSEIEEVCGAEIVKAAALRLLLITPVGELSVGEKDILASVVRNIFPPEQGCLCVQTEGSRQIVICPVDCEVGKEIETLAATLCDTIMAEAMVLVRVSLSSVFGDINEVSAGFQQAERARMIGETFDLTDKYYDYNTLGLEKFVFSFPTQACVEYVKETFGENFLNERSAGELLLTVKTFLDCNQNGSEAARVLYIHRNTMMYRLDKFNRLTGLDCAQFNTGLRIRLAMMILQYLEKKDLGLLRGQK